MIKHTNLPQQMANDLIALTDLQMNVTGIVHKIDAGIKATQRLSGLGITPGIKITKLSAAPFHGPVQIQIRGTRLAIGQGLAAKIIVQLTD